MLLSLCVVCVSGGEAGVAVIGNVGGGLSKGYGTFLDVGAVLVILSPYEDTPTHHMLHIPQAVPLSNSSQNT